MKDGIRVLPDEDFKVDTEAKKIDPVPQQIQESSMT